MAKRFNLLSGGKKYDVLHPQRLENSRAEKFIQRFSRNDFHQTAQHVDAEAVFEPVPRIKQQRKRGQVLHVIGDRAVKLQQPAGYISLFVRRSQIVIPLIGNSRSVAQQVANRDFLGRRNRVSCARRGLHQHPSDS